MHPRSHTHSLTAVIVCSLATLLINIDNTAYQVAAPTLVKNRGVSPSFSGWFLGSVVITLGACEWYAGAKGVRLGRKRLLEIGLVVYILGCLLTAYPTPGVLSAGEVVAGIGAAALIPMGLAIIRTIARNAAQLRLFTSLGASQPGLEWFSDRF